MKRIGGLLLVILGLAVAGFGVFRAATAEDSAVVSVTVPGGESQFIYTAPGVLSLVDDAVSVTLEGKGTVQWALATTLDAQAYIGDAPATEVTGLQTWQAATSETVAGTEEARAAIEEAAAGEGGFTITGSDLWLESGSGEGSAEVDLSPDTRSQQSLIATTSTGQAPDLTLTWKRSLTTTNPVPIIAIGVLAFLIGVLLLLSYHQARQARRSVENTYRERRERSEAETSIMPRIGTRGRSAGSDARQFASEASGGAYGAGILPAANQELRERELSDADRVVLPLADEEPEESTDDVVEPADAPAEDEQAPVGSEEQGQGGADQTKGASADERDWRSLWNFSWGTPFQKGDEDA